MTSTIAGLLDDAAAARPDQRLLLGVDGGVLTVAEVARLSTARIRWLADSGVRPGMTVAWQLPSHSAGAVLMLALARTGTIQAPVLHLCRQREVRAALDVAAADIPIVDDSTAINAPPDVSLVTLPADFLEVVRGAPGGPDPTLAASRSPDDARWIYFTSGTTGRPKGVRHTDATLLAAARGYTAHLGLGSHPDEVGTIGFPIGHVGGILYLASALIGAFPALLIPKVDAAELPRQLAENQVTISGSSTAFYQLLLTAQLASGSTEPLIPLAAHADRRGCAVPIRTSPQGAYPHGRADRSCLRNDRSPDDLRQRSDRFRGAAVEQLRQANSGCAGTHRGPRRDRTARRQRDPGLRRGRTVVAGDDIRWLVPYR